MGQVIKFLSVKRSHGLGNVLMLIPVLDSLSEKGHQIHVVTDEKWVTTLQVLRPEYLIDTNCHPDTIDLDLITASKQPGTHRIEEYASILGVDVPLAALKLTIPTEWQTEFLPWRGAVGFAPQAGHPSRQWPDEYSFELAAALLDSPLVLLGTDRQPAIPCNFDSRAKLRLNQLMGLLSLLQLLICMDSGLLHLGTALGIRTLCIFGGIDPRFRILETQPVVAMQADLDCCPCNKRETCNERYDCMKVMSPQHVLHAISNFPSNGGRSIHRIPAC
jgi:ADP-heptose:LPS heptosyltransferase